MITYTLLNFPHINKNIYMIDIFLINCSENKYEKNIGNYYKYNNFS
jgi:hypothetical protein